MKLNKILILLVVTYFFMPVSAQAEPEIAIIKHAKVLENNDPQKNFFIYILDLACKASEDKYGPCKLEASDVPMLQERQLKSLNSGLLDITWTAYRIKESDKHVQ